MNDSIFRYFKDIRIAGQQKRASNREKSSRLLTDNGIEFESKNNGAHLVVKCHDTFFDFWPGTGLWRSRSSSINGRGVKSLISAVKSWMD